MAYVPVAERRAREAVERKRERERAEQQCREKVIAEFSGDLQAMADEILRFQSGLAQLGGAVDWLKRGAPCIVIPPGPYWKPKPEQANDH